MDASQQADFTLTVHWDGFMGRLQAIPSPDSEHQRMVEQTTEFLRRIQEEDLPCEYVLDIPRECFQMAWKLNDETRQQDPIMEAAQLGKDEESWASLLHDLYKTPARCDPSLGGEFI